MEWPDGRTNTKVLNMQTQNSRNYNYVKRHLTPALSQIWQVDNRPVSNRRENVTYPAVS